MQDDRYKLPAAALSRCSTSVCQLQYKLPEQQHKSVCEVKYICLGPALACIAATCSGSRLITLNIHLQQYFQSRDYKGEKPHILMICMQLLNE